ncbi:MULTISPECIES: MbnP family protein [Flagellimonas]|uniref:Copper-binding protein MbnP-like domain-containing protein n=1 Tax=Flagellimonas hadalis TaxID=2597517 RepID=A0A5N5IXM7_9FLAO|nr:MbnP family protein [Allomuricauda hadalis]KAB5491467.1 hypothetical protein FOT42_000525 [Allomuricauda hadalis]RUA18029.1 MAG: hypothetical protein DSY83_03095 [Flavobacteriia bacterium]
MKNFKNILLLFTFSIAMLSCSDSDDAPVANDVTLKFLNTFGDETIVLGDATSSTATENTSSEGQVHHFAEVKYVISNIRLIQVDGTEIPYNINDLDNGATVVNLSNPSSLNYVLNTIPSGEYNQIKFGLGVRSNLNTLDQVSFPSFYALAGENDTEMHWEWGTGYRFTKIEGFYDTDDKTLSIHTGSTVEGTIDDESTYTQGVDAYREIALDLPTNATVGSSAPTITIKADFDMLLSGATNTIILGEGNATPSIHTAANMVLFVDNLGGNGTSDTTGMFSIESVEN